MKRTPTGTRRISTRVPAPTQLPQRNLVWLLDASSGVTTSGTDVIEWADSVGTNDLDVVDGTPQYVASGVNANPYVTFDGLGDALSRATFSGLPLGSTSRTLLTVQNYQSGGVAGVAYGNPDFDECYGNVITPAVSGGLLMLQLWGPRDLQTTAPGLNAGLLSQIARTSDQGSGSLNQVFRNRGLVGASTDAPDTTAGNGIVIGKEIDGAPYIELDLYLVAMWSPALSYQETMQAFGHVAWRFGLQAL